MDISINLLLNNYSWRLDYWKMHNAEHVLKHVFKFSETPSQILRDIEFLFKKVSSAKTLTELTH